MRRIIRFAFVLACLLHSAAVGASVLPDVSSRVGRAQSFTYDFTPDQYQHAFGRRDVTWNNQPSQAQGMLNLPPGTVSGAYIAVARLPSYAEVHGPVILPGWNLAWFQANHPEFILLTKDHATPAYEYGDTSWIPLNYSSPFVQAWLNANEIGPLISAGYQAISVDNVSVQNDFDREGTCSKAVPSGQTPPATCESVGGTWTQLWTGQVLGDAQFVSDQVAWLQYLAGVVRAHNVALMVNIAYNPADLVGTKALIAAADIWYDEAGFTGDAGTPACDPAGGGSGVVGQAWIDKFTFVDSLAPNPNFAYVSENGLCQFGDPKSQAVLDYALASYLMVKNAHTYFLWFFNGDTAAYQDTTPGGSWPEYDWVHGAALDWTNVTSGVYWRSFANGLALLNPSTTASAGYNLPNGVTYKDFGGNVYAGAVSLAPTTGLILLPCSMVATGLTATFTNCSSVTVVAH